MDRIVDRNPTKIVVLNKQVVSIRIFLHNTSGAVFLIWSYFRNLPFDAISDKIFEAKGYIF